MRADFSSAPSPARHGDSAEKPSWSHDSGDIRACGNLWKKSPRRSPSPVEKNGRGIKNSASHLLGRHSKFVKELSEPINFPSFRAQGCRSEESRLPINPELMWLSCRADSVDPGFLTTQTPFGRTDLNFFTSFQCRLRRRKSVAEAVERAYSHECATGSGDNPFDFAQGRLRPRKSGKKAVRTVFARGARAAGVRLRRPRTACTARKPSPSLRSRLSMARERG